MADIRVGVIGVGVMGSAHSKNINTSVDGAVVTALFDLDTELMTRVAAELTEISGTPITQHASVESLVADENIDAVIICSPDHLHPQHLELVLAAKKDVLCEKPLAQKSEEAKRVARLAKDSEQIVALGFMRRFDPAYIALKAAIASKKYGELLQIRATSRNVSSPNGTTTGLLTNVAVHEIDICRWLLNEEITSIQTIKTKRSARAVAGLQDPLSVIMHTESGVLVTVDIAANSTYGYEIGMEALMENGSLVIENLGDFSIAFDFVLPPRKGGKLGINWMERFEDAYIYEARAWIDSIKNRKLNPDLATVDDGVAAAVACELGLASLIAPQPPVLEEIK